jgi:large subunit ribosomal protein L32
LGGSQEFKIAKRGTKSTNDFFEAFVPFCGGNGVIMPNPKRRHSKARRDKRRAHDALRVPQTTLCPNCREPRMPHRVCPKCGYYKGREVMQVEQT